MKRYLALTTVFIVFMMILSSTVSAEALYTWTGVEERDFAFPNNAYKAVDLACKFNESGFISENYIVLTPRRENGSYINFQNDVRFGIQSYNDLVSQTRKFYVRVVYQNGTGSWTHTNAMKFYEDIPEYELSSNYTPHNNKYYRATANVFPDKLEFNFDNKVYHTIKFSDMNLPSEFHHWEFVHAYVNQGTEGAIDVYENNYYPPGGGGSSNSDEPSVKIIQPLTGFKDSQMNYIATTVAFNNIPFDGNVANMKVGVTGYKTDTKTWFLDFSHTVNPNGTISGFYKMGGYVKFNLDQILTAKLTDFNGQSYTDSISVYIYEDFVDEDGDGSDDRTNVGQPDITLPQPPSDSPWLPKDDGNIDTGSLDSIFDSVANFGGQFMEMFAKVFSFIPAPIIALITASFAVGLALRIFGR